MKIVCYVTTVIICLAALANAKKYIDRYALAHELYQYGMTNITTWVCIIGQASDYDTSKIIRNGEHVGIGLFQIVNPTWCVNAVNAENITFPCTKLLDDNIIDDVFMAKQVLKEFSWTAWGHHYEICKNEIVVPDYVWE